MCLSGAVWCSGCKLSRAQWEPGVAMAVVHCGGGMEQGSGGRQVPRGLWG